MVLSILMSVYNENVDDLVEAIDSVLNQTFQNFEFIIVLDNPNKSSVKRLLNEYSNVDHRIRIIENNVNVGLAESMNNGLKYCKGEYIVRMDADDICHNKRLEILQQEISKHKDVDVFYSTFRTISDDGKLLKDSPAVPTNNEELGIILKKYKNIICHPTVAIKKRSLEQVDGYSDLRIVEDYELWLTMLRHGFIFYGINQSLIDVRLHGDSMTTSNYYKSYLALEFIKERSSEGLRVKNKQFNNYYQQKAKKTDHYNKYARKYFKLINEWNQQDYSKFLKLAYLFFAEPRLIRFFYETYKAMQIRRRYGNGHER